jgi:hypothetical protein
MINGNTCAGRDQHHFIENILFNAKESASFWGDLCHFPSQLLAIRR